jgi:hypothetical protein
VPNLTQFFSLLFSEERVLDRKLPASAYSASVPRQPRKCPSCKKPGHSRDECWKEHPEKEPLHVCTRCNQRGHYERLCEKKKDKAFITDYQDGPPLSL